MSAFVPPRSWQSRPSPNHNARPATAKISGIVLHADASSSVASSMDWIRRSESQVSYHVLIGRRGDVYLIVPPEQRAWHAGRSVWDGVSDCNDYTIGVCLSNRNDGEEPYAEAQRIAAIEVCAELCRHFAIPASRITTHALIATPAGRKTDPRGLELPPFRAAVATALRTKTP